MSSGEDDERTASHGRIIGEVAAVVHMWSVSCVSRHSASGRLGQITGSSTIASSAAGGPGANGPPLGVLLRARRGRGRACEGCLRLAHAIQNLLQRLFGVVQRRPLDGGHPVVVLKRVKLGQEARGGLLPPR